MNFHIRHTLRGYRTQIYTVRHFRSILFVIDEAFLNSQTRKMNLLLRPIRYWNRWRDKHHCDLLNGQKKRWKEWEKRFHFMFIADDTTMLWWWWWCWSETRWEKEWSFSLPPSLQWTSIGRWDLSVLPTTERTRRRNSRMAFENGHECECHSV